MTEIATERLLTELRRWIPAASRAGGLSPFVVVVEAGQPYISHQMGAGMRLPTTFELLEAAETAGLVQFTEGWNGRLRDFRGEIALPLNDVFDGQFTAMGLMLLLNERPAHVAFHPSIQVIDSLRDALTQAADLVRELRRAVDAATSPEVRDDEASIVILERIVIPELRRLPDEMARPDFDATERIRFLTRLKSFLWDERLIGLVSVIISLYVAMT